MKARDFLQQVSKLDMIIKNKMIEKEQWMAIASSTSVSASDGERVQSSGSQQKMADAVIRMVGIEEEIDRYVDSLVDARKEVIRTIEMLPAAEYDLLHKIYIGIIDPSGEIRYLTLAEAADLKKKAYSWATTVHGRALKHVQDILDGRRKNECNK